MKKVVLIGIMAVALSACGVSVGYDYAQFGTEDGINANGDQLNALVTNGKASADKKSAAYVLREVQEKQRTLRESQGFLSSLFRKSEAKQ